jgi:NADPH:quinone reductase-like Zn-dependent oxidoreductase
VITGAPKTGMVRLLARVIGGLVQSRFDRRLVSFVARARYEDLVFLKELVEAGKLCPVIDREYTLSDAAEAVRYLGTGQARAKVVITM